MIPNGLRMAGTIPYRGRLLASWTPIITSPWYLAVNDSMNPSPVDSSVTPGNYGFVPSSQSIISGSTGSVQLDINNFPATDFDPMGTTNYFYQGKAATFETSIQVHYTSSYYAGDVISIGFANNVNWVGSSIFCGFFHQSGPGNNWFCVCNRGSLFSQDSGVVIPISGGTFDLKMTISSDGLTITWFINGIQVAQLTNTGNAYWPSTGEPLVVLLRGSSPEFSGTFTMFSITEITLK